MKWIVAGFVLSVITLCGLIFWATRASNLGHEVPIYCLILITVVLFGFFLWSLIEQRKRPPPIGKYMVYKEDESLADPCSICLIEMVGGNKVVGLECGHQFHPSCVSDWAMKCPSCPSCRQSVV